MNFNTTGSSNITTSILQLEPTLSITKKKVIDRNDEQLFRVRELLSYLNYDELVEEKIIPSDVFSNFGKKKAFPPWGYTSPSSFGLFIEDVLFEILHNLEFLCNNKHVICVQPKWIEQLPKLYKRSFHSSSVPFDLNQQLDYQYFNALYNFVFQQLAPYIFDATSSIPRRNDGHLVFEREPEIEYENVSGHPDMICHNNILDVKTTSNFQSMRKSTVLQLLSYSAITSGSGKKYQYIGVILPQTKEIILYDVSLWNYKPFLSLLIKAAASINVVELQTCFIYHQCEIGAHISKGKNWLQNFTQPNSRIQMFLSSPRKVSYFRPSQDEILQASQLIAYNNIHYYTHSPYYINLSKPYNADSIKEQQTTGVWKSYSLEILKHELQLTAAIGGRGVVVHLGSNEDKVLGLEQMYRSIKEVLPYATKTCPLLLETAAGEGNDLCWKLNEFIDLYNMFDVEEKSKLQLCVDTCHVFACGYNPVYFIQKLIENKLPVPLIHFNDSKNPQGSHVDRHASLGKGYIGKWSLLQVLQICIQNNIDMVVE
jgi:deoxyribonuclease-4